MKEVLLERVIPETSSLVEYLIYDSQQKSLEVKYKRGKHKGKARKYGDFSKEEFDYITQSSSVGKTLLSVLKRKSIEKKNKSIWGFLQSVFTSY